MTVSVVIPYRAGGPHRARALDWVREQYRRFGWEFLLGASPDGPFSRAAAILDGVHRAASEVIVVADADAWTDGTPCAVEQVLAGARWVVPHWSIHRLSPDSTTAVLAGAHWRGLPLSTDNPQDSKPYRGHETGTIVVMRRDTLLEVPPDRRFVGWGHEDDAWACALRTLVGPPIRRRDDLVHLWHPPQPRESRRVGSSAGVALYRRYRAALHRPDVMRALIAEAR